MKFLILTQYYPPEVGAAQVRLAAFARELDARGHDVTVVTALPNYPSGRLDPDDRWRLGRRERLGGISVLRTWIYAATGTGIRRLLSYLTFAATGGVGALQTAKPDVVFVESPPLFLGVAGWIAARRFGAAFVLNISDLWPDSVRDLGLMRTGPWIGAATALERWLYARADAVTAVTDGIRQRLIENKGVSPDRVLFLPNGADTEVLQARPDVGAPVRPFVLYTGNHGLAQGLDVILDAAEHVPEVDFVLIGDGSDKARLVDRARARALRNVHFQPPVPSSEIANRYAGATAGIACLRRSSLMEGARPAKLLAIMACGRPVIYSGAGEGADLVLSADAGIVAEPENPEALADAVREIVAEPGRAAVMGSNGRRYVEENLSWPSLVGEWLEQFSHIAGPKP